jgi:hypothetical protein
MKATVFEKLIRKVVREEIDYALRREIKTLKEDLREELKPQVVEQPLQRTPIPENVQTSLKEKIMGKKIISQQFTSNSALNDLLNETAQGDTNLESTLTSAQPMPASVANVVNRDYRELMKAMDKRKTHRP